MKSIKENKETEMSPEIQEQYDMFVINSMNIIHKPEVSETLLILLSKGGDPIQTFADKTVDIVNRLAKSAIEAGTELAPDVLLHGGNAVLGELITVAEAAGMEPLDEDQKAEALQHASAQFLDDSVSSGAMSKETLADLGQQAEGSTVGKDIVAKKDEIIPEGKKGLLRGQNG